MRHTRPPSKKCLLTGSDAMVALTRECLPSNQEKRLCLPLLMTFSNTYTLLVDTWSDCSTSDTMILMTQPEIGLCSTPTMPGSRGQSPSGRVRSPGQPPPVALTTVFTGVRPNRHDHEPLNFVEPGGPPRLPVAPEPAARSPRRVPKAAGPCRAGPPRGPRQCAARSSTSARPQY